MELLKQKINNSLLETTGHGLCSSLLEMCVQKFRVDLYSRFCIGARQVFTTQKPFPTEIPLTMKTATSNPL